MSNYRGVCSNNNSYKKLSEDSFADRQTDEARQERLRWKEMDVKAEREKEEYFRSDEYKDFCETESSRACLSAEYKRTEAFQHARHHIQEQKRQFDYETKMMKKNGIKENIRDRVHVLGSGSSGFSGSDSGRVMPVEENINRFTNFYSNQCLDSENKMNDYISDIRLYHRGDGCSCISVWCNKPFNWYPERILGNILLTTIPLSDKALKRHLATHYQDINGNSRFNLKSSICLPCPSAMYNIHNYFILLQSMMVSKRRILCDRMYYDLIAITIIRIACPSINMNAFVEFFKLMSKIKMLESLIIGESLLYEKLHQEKVMFIILMVERMWNELSDIGQELSIYGENYICGFSDNHTRRYDVVRSFFTSCINKFFIVFNEIEHKSKCPIDYSILEITLQTFWGTTYLISSENFYSDCTDKTENDILKDKSVLEKLGVLTGCKMKCSSIVNFIVSGVWIRFPDVKEMWDRKVKNVRLSSLMNFYQINGKLLPDLFKHIKGYSDVDNRDFEVDNQDKHLIAHAIKYSGYQYTDSSGFTADKLREYNERVKYISNCQYNRWKELHSDDFDSSRGKDRLDKYKQKADIEISVMKPSTIIKREKIEEEEIVVTIEMPKSKAIIVDSVFNYSNKTGEIIASEVIDENISYDRVHLLSINKINGDIVYGFRFNRITKLYELPFGDNIADIGRKLSLESICSAAIKGIDINIFAKFSDKDFVRSIPKSGIWDNDRINSYLSIEGIIKELTYFPMSEMKDSKNIDICSRFIINHFEKTSVCAVFRWKCSLCDQVRVECKCSSTKSNMFLVEWS